MRRWNLSVEKGIIIIRVANEKRHRWVSVGRSPLFLLLTIKEGVDASLDSLRKRNIFYDAFSHLLLFLFRSI